ncbi:MAG TPA: addiction module protein, partial [Candidatus Methylomirabilis sp.]
GKPAINLDTLTVEERLQLLEEVWDSLSGTPQRLPLTDAQREELDRRLDEIEGGDVTGIPWDEVLEQIRRRRK